MPAIETVLAENEELKGRIAELEAQIAWFKRQVFGGGKSEKLDPAQLELLKGLEEKSNELKKQKLSYERKKPEKRRSREELYGHLPIREENILLPEEMKSDPEAYVEIGREVSYEVRITPPEFYRVAIIRPKVRRKDDKNSAPLVAPAPPRIVEGIASVQLLSYIVISKYLDHLPLYRQCAIYKRHGFHTARQNLVRWVEKVAEWLKPIYNHIGKELLAGDYIQADETPIQYCDPDYGEKKSRKGYLCGYSRPGDQVYYRWSPNRAHKNLTVFLEDYQGLLQSDAYDAYIRFAQDNKNVTLAGCMAHARRKFFDAKDQHPRECALVLKLIARLYQVEKHIRETGLNPEATRKYRQTHATNTHQRLKRVLIILRHRSLPKTGLGKACNYALNNWNHLSTYMDHGQVHIDNNAMENAIRPTAVGKKNWLFVGHPQAGERAAIIYSILISCQRLDISPQDYLNDILSRDTRILQADQLAALTPKNWLTARQN